MAALDLGYLLRGAGRAVTGYRQGTREREEMERAREVEDAERMFKEWSQKRQFELQREQREQAERHFGLTRGDLTEERKRIEARAQRDDQRADEAARVAAGGKGYEPADMEMAQTATNAAMAGMGMGRLGTSRAQPSAPFKGRVGNVSYDAPTEGPVQYETVGGRMMRRDPQKAKNEALAKEMREHQERLGVAREQAALRPDPADARPTEGESKDYLFAQKLRRGQETMDAFRDKIRPEAVTAYLFGRFMKPTLTSAEQQFVNGAKHFASGVLRKETGAAVQAEELKDVWDRFIDAGLDAPEVRELKQRARVAETEALDRMSARARSYYERQRPSLSEIIKR